MGKAKQSRVNQIDLIAAICKYLDKSGVKTMIPRQYNAVIAGANLILESLARPPVMATPGIGLSRWFGTDDTGASSKYMAEVLSRPKPWVENNHPHDPDDFGRCVRLLDAAPELRGRIGILTEPEHGKVWNAIASEWDTLEAWYREDEPSGKSERLFKRLQAISAPAKV